MKWLWLVCLWFATGCASTVLDAKTFEKDCVTPGQCRPVYFGDICGNACMCPNGAVNEQGYAKYDLERQGIKCTQPQQGIACDCAQPITACSPDGQCGLQ